MSYTYEKSCGAVLYTRDNGDPEYVIIQNKSGFFGFPKGHVENGETEKETALREIREEVGITPIFIDGFREVDEYPIPGKEGAIKQVVYFLAEYSHQAIVCQQAELRDAKPIRFEEAMDSLQFNRVKEILGKAHQAITGSTQAPSS